MTTERSSSHGLGTERRPWTLEVDAEVGPAAPDVTAQRAASLAALLAGVPGVEQVDARPHCRSRFVLIRLTVGALDIADASDRACESVHRCAAEAGLTPLMLVGVRCV